MGQIGFFFNMNTCIACGACQTACKDGRNLSAGKFFRRAEMVEVNGCFYPYSGACNHCAEPGCAAVCPTGSMYRREDGTVMHEDSLCIGCGTCLWNCPYGAVSFSNIKGTSQKCDGCATRREDGLLPLCVDACPTQSLLFGKIEDLAEKNEGLVPDLPFLPNSEITKPSLLIRHKGGMLIV